MVFDLKNLVSRLKVILPCLLLALGAQSVLAQTATDSLDEVVVSGERPGPALWKVSKGDHELWILATLVPMPKQLSWRSRQVESRIAGAQEIIVPPEFRPDIGLFRALTLLPSLLRARHSPDGKTLEEELPHDVYIRWLALRVRYLPHSDEKQRPMVAAYDLFDHAIDAVGLTMDDDAIWSVLRKAAKSANVPMHRIEAKMPVDDPKGVIQSLALIPQDAELACLEDTLSNIETGLPTMIRRANLWALGDIDGLRESSPRALVRDCKRAFFAVPEMKKALTQVETAMENAWLQAIDEALTRNISTFMAAGVDELLEQDGLLAKLRAMGYIIQEPLNGNG